MTSKVLVSVQTIEYTFTIGQILSIITGRVLCPSYNDVKEVTEAFGNHPDYWIAKVPALADVPKYDAPASAWHGWLTGVVAKLNLPATVTVVKEARRDHADD